MKELPEMQTISARPFRRRSGWGRAPHRPACFAMALLLSACGKEPERESVGGETNWLKACVVDSDCASSQADRCLCGICTKSCPETGCANDEICVASSSEASRLLCQAAVVPSRCLPRCGSLACREGFACTDGACVPAAGLSPRAFPGAEGFGAGVTGGRGGRVVHVTTLAADGPGSLSEALALPYPRIIVFDVSGVISAPAFEIAQGNVTIAGQSAPGAGITLTGPLRGRYDASVGNIVLRHLRLRPHYDGSDIAQYDALQLSKNRRLMIDHVSLAFAVDESVDLLEAQDVTVQWSSIETIDDRDNPTERFIRGIVAGPNSARISVHHLLCTHNRGSCVSLAGGPAELVNSHFEDVRAAFTHSEAAHGPFSFVGNTFYSGPNLTLLPFVFDDEAATPASDLAYYLSDNVLLNTTGDCASGNVDDPWRCTYDLGRGSNYRSVAPVDFAQRSPDWVPITRSASTDEPAALLDRVGAKPTDATTARAIADVLDHSGLLDAAYPTNLLEGLNAQRAAMDSDGDFLPDAWERSEGLDPSDPSDQHAILGSGYDAVEEYLNQLAAAITDQGD